MKERPILFSGPMVRTILDGRKTQTRRVMKDRLYDLSTVRNTCMEGFPAMRDGFAVFDIQDTVDSSHEYKIRCPYGVPGDRLWVRETWRVRGKHTDRCTVPEVCANRGHFEVAHQASITWNDDMYGKVRPSIHMPRWASRIDLDITGVRVERVCEMDCARALAEGMSHEYVDLGLDDGYRVPNPVDQFIVLWNSLNAKRGYGWDVNPWVWVIEFKRSER